MSSIKLLPIIVYMGLNLNFLPGLAGTPEAQHYVANEGYENKLFMEMWSNFENEQKAEEETVEGDISVTEVVQNETEAVPVQNETTVEATNENILCPIYAVSGHVLDEGVQAYLYEKLAAANIEWFMPYAVLIAWGESRFNPSEVNQKNFIDKGLFQFRETYWSGGDIFNPYTQVDVFVGLMANRAAAGCTVSDMISRHNVSDYGAYNQEYVDYIMKDANNLVRIR